MGIYVSLRFNSGDPHQPERAAGFHGLILLYRERRIGSSAVPNPYGAVSLMVRQQFAKLSVILM